mgnify:CR=1 FL=1
MYNMGVGLVTKMSVAILLIWHGIFLCSSICLMCSNIFVTTKINFNFFFLISENITKWVGVVTKSVVLGVNPFF